MTLKTVNFEDFYNIISKNQNQRYPLKILFKNEKELSALKRICLSKNISFIENIEKQIEEFKDIYTQIYKQDSNSYNYFLERIRCIDATNYGEFIYLGWGSKCIINLMGKDYLYDLLCWKNRGKLDSSEQRLISTKSIGVVGCSVGSFATKALSKLGFQRFNIADTEQVMPSSSSSVYCDSVRNYGEQKSKALIESLYDYNPYIGINLFEKGLDSNNTNDFFYFDNKKIDIVIDTNSDKRLKQIIKSYCQKHKVPLIAVGDEKGILIVNRYDHSFSSDIRVSEYTSFATGKDIYGKSHSNSLDSLSVENQNIEFVDSSTLEKSDNSLDVTSSMLSCEIALLTAFISNVSLDISLNESYNEEFSDRIVRNYSQANPSI